MSPTPNVPLTPLTHCKPAEVGRRTRLVLGALGAALLVSGAVSSSALAADVFPIPGARVASPGTQIAFRGIAPSQLTGITVTGSRSGAHGGSIRADSDGFGGSFLPGRAFRAGETVTVHTHFSITGARDGTFSFQVANPASGLPQSGGTATPRTPGDVDTFHTTSLRPAAVRMDRTGGEGDIFLDPQRGPLTAGAEIVDRNGHLVWYHPTPAGISLSDFRVQSYLGRPALTWWQGRVNGGIGSGTDDIYDNSYRPIATVHAANGLGADLHEFEITSANTALVTAYYPVYVNGRSVHLPSRQIVLDSVVQEIDIPTGLVLFQWDSLDHVPLTDSHGLRPASRTRQPFDYFHVNSIDVDPDGNLVISARNTWAAYKVSRQTGQVIWTLGGRHSTFKLGPGATFAFQHDVRIRSAGDTTVTLFDDGGGPPKVHQSRAVELALDLTHRAARLVYQRQHSPSLAAFFEGNNELLLNLDAFVGWGGMPYFTEYDRSGKVILDGRFVGANTSYRAYRFGWTGAPLQPPAIAVTKRGSRMVVYASWNGATSVWSWQVLGGTSASALRPLATSRSHGFETGIETSAQRAVAVQALDRAGHVLGRSVVTGPR